MAHKRVVVDGANVAYAEKTQDGKAKVSNLVAMQKALEDEGYEPIIIVGASLKYEVTDREQFEARLEGETWQQAPADTDADYFTLETADRFEAPVVSNDEFEDWTEEYPWIQQRRVPFMIVEGRVEIYKHKLSGEREGGQE